MLLLNAVVAVTVAAALWTPPCVVYVTPPGWATKPDLVRTARAAARGGAAAVQLRDKDASAAELRAATAALRDCGCPVIVNGAPRVAVECGADGVHLTERALLAATARPTLRIVGASAHSVASVLRAASLGLDYVQLGTMFATQTHPEKVAFEGPAFVAQAREQLTSSPPLLIGVGGIDVSNCADVVRAGADGVAVIRAIALSDDPAAVVRDLRAAMRPVSTSPR